MAVEEKTVRLLLLWVFLFRFVLFFVGCGEDLHSLFLGFPHLNCDIPQRGLGNCKVNPHPEAGFMVEYRSFVFKQFRSTSGSETARYLNPEDRTVALCMGKSGR